MPVLTTDICGRPQVFAGMTGSCVSPCTEKERDLVITHTYMHMMSNNES